MLLAALTVGIAFRLLQYLGNRSFWQDEALAARTFLENTVRQLLNPSVFQSVPPGYYVLQRLAALAFGISEFSLRLIPLVAGLASLLLFPVIARRAMTGRAVPVAVALFAISPFLIYYSSEAKRYSTDVFFSTLVLLGAVAIYERGITLRRVSILAAAGSIFTFFSFTAALVLGGTLLGLLAAAALRGDRRTVRLLAAAFATVAVLLSVPFLFLLPRLADSAVGSTFWHSGFMPLPPQSLAEWGWFPKAFLQLFRDPLGAHNQTATSSGFYQAAAGMICFVAGVFWMWSNRRGILFVLLGPIFVALLASGLKLYPFGGWEWLTGGRSILYLMPIFFILIGEGAEQLRETLQPNLRAVPIGIFALLFGPLLVENVVMIPYGRSEVRPIVEYIAEERQPNDVVFVHYDAKPMFKLYADRFGFQEGDYTTGICSRFRMQEYLEQVTQLRGNPRVWFLFGSGIGAYRFDEKRLILDYLDHIGTRLDDQVALGSSTYLYDMSASGSGTPRYRANIPVLPPNSADGCDIWW